MKKFSALITALLFVVLCACSFGTGEGYRSFFGAEVDLYIKNRDLYISDKNYGKLMREIDALVSELSLSCSADCVGGDIARYNSLAEGEKTEVSSDTAKLYSLAYDLYLKTDGAYNPAVKYLVDLWGFAARHSDLAYTPTYPYDREMVSGGFALPDEKYVTAFKALADLKKAELKAESGKYYLVKNCEKAVVDGVEYFQQLDLSGIAKGVFCDRAVEIIKNYGVTEFYISVGGSSLYLGESEGKDWTMEVVDPFSASRAPFAKIKVKNKSVSTSGTYEHTYTFDGKIYNHIIDGKTGRPTESDIVSATLIGDDGGYIDGLSTALVVLGSEKALKLLDDEKGLGYVLVTSEKRVITNLGADFSVIDGLGYTVENL